MNRAVADYYGSRNTRLHFPIRKAAKDKQLDCQIPQVIFGSPDNFHREHLTFHIAPFQSGYQALLGRDAFARFNAIPHYVSLTLKMPGPCGIIAVNGNMERSLRTEENAAVWAAAH